MTPQSKLRNKQLILLYSACHGEALVRPEEFESPTSRVRSPVFYPVELETHIDRADKDLHLGNLECDASGIYRVYAPLKIGRGYWIRTNDTDFKDQCLRPD